MYWVIAWDASEDKVDSIRQFATLESAKEEADNQLHAYDQVSIAQEIGHSANIIQMHGG